ncbi:TIGR01777 family oxidoreductase [Ulvibacter litoralis]|uniref:TIGR01777 family protein n=1 Tax=Ulvibacter litoralis TaxID=227084 RepID=A0A1G7GR79_9FLAO|nr:TIGR01777 family oxidoreductase [Ulvibacter litoralis]GHC55356.1 NAD-dependent epimerase [Ulvibacter litoralis]SDE90647.1 hypothetical protein SAMN05421855_103290 [Ulvibacter litoralis]
MKVLITGATGLIGSALVKLCHSEGVVVHYFTTRKEKIENRDTYKGFYWNPAKNEIDARAFEGVTAIVNLAGATVSKRWTSRYKKEILSSRTEPAKLIYDTLKNTEHTITHFISASGISIYPASETRLYTEESSEEDTSFLATVVKAWEASANQFRDLGMDVAVVRTGMVLAKDAGALPKLVKTIKMGFGACLGNGQQWQSWIHIDDIARIYFFMLINELEGVYNAVAPSPVTNQKMTKLLAKKLDAPLWLPNVPAFALKLLLGEMAVLALEGQLVNSKKIEASGFFFTYSSIDAALKDLL